MFMWPCHSLSCHRRVVWELYWTFSFSQRLLWSLTSLFAANKYSWVASLGKSLGAGKCLTDIVVVAMSSSEKVINTDYVFFHGLSYASMSCVKNY